MTFYMKQLRSLPTMKMRNAYFGNLHGRDIMKWVNKFYGSGMDIMQMGASIQSELGVVPGNVIYKIAFSLDCLFVDIKKAGLLPKSPKKTYTVEEIAAKILACDDQFFTVTFIKRTSGETRVMNCRRNVVKHLAGGELKYNMADKGLISVWDRQADGYRAINIGGIVSATINGTTYSTQ